MHSVIAQHSAIEPSAQRRTVIVTDHHGEKPIPITWPVAYRLVIQVPGSLLMPRPPRTSTSAIDVTWSLNSEVSAAISTPSSPTSGLISIRPPDGWRDPGAAPPSLPFSP